MIVEEKNLLVLAKTLEIYMICSKTNVKLFESKDLQALEKIIFDIVKKLPVNRAASPALVNIF
jgi:hypothetical protein